MSEIKRIETGSRMSKAVVHGGIVYLAGIVPADLSQGIEGQTREVLAEIDRLLTLAGSDRTRILRANLWLSTMADFAGMNSVWDAWVAPGHTPARATVEAKLASPEIRVEIMVIAAA